MEMPQSRLSDDKEDRTALSSVDDKPDDLSDWDWEEARHRRDLIALLLDGTRAPFDSG
jgi:hypothetical protein